MGTTRHWLKLKLDEGTRSNRAAINARIRVTMSTPPGNREIYKTVNRGGSFGSSSRRQERGFGDAPALASIEVSWPNYAVEIPLQSFKLDLRQIRSYRPAGAEGP